jgi:3-oxo-5-alpha-steroid 4-dehydrogenase 3 / polyprenol reductase
VDLDLQRLHLVIFNSTPYMPWTWDSLIVVGLRSFFLIASAGVLIARAVPFLRTAFIPYGKTRTTPPKSNSYLIQYLSNITVPKAWFWHYYLLSVTLSVVSGFHIVDCSDGAESRIFKNLSMVNGRILLAWGMMFIQGCRRLCESTIIQRPSSARMWIGHYLVGCSFYIMMCPTIFAERPKRMDGSS